MTDKKSNPVMTPEWFASLLETCVVPDGVLQVEIAPSTSPIPTDTEGNVLPEPPAYRKELDEGLPVPILDEFADTAGHYDKAKEAFMEYHRKRRTEDAEYEIAAEQSTAAAPPERSPILTALSELIARLWDGNYEDARQATQTLNRLLATGGKVDPMELRELLFDIVE